METREVKINVEVGIQTHKETDEVINAIRKGIYWGLDIRRIARPVDVVIECTEENPFNVLFEEEPAKPELIEMDADEFNRLVEKHYGGSFEFEAIEEANNALYKYEISEHDAKITMDFGECEKIRAGKYPMYCIHHVFKCLFEDGHIKAGRYLIDNRH
jgi:hypothetical protein